MTGNEKEFLEFVTDAVYRGWRKFTNEMLSIVAIVFVISWAVSWAVGDFDRDNTDGASRSGMKLHHDAKTGCQYLSVVGGGITPRMSHDGLHLGCKK